jgi:hypothetical protein
MMAGPRISVRPVADPQIAFANVGRGELRSPAP